jgi:hypothetical protein
MTITLVSHTAALSDADLLARLTSLASRERETTVELVAHLAELDRRPALYAARGFGSLFGYCTQALRLSEDAACARIEAARTCRRFPDVLDLLASGALSLTSVRLLGRHLTAENYRSVLARARGRSRREIEALVAELAPQPDTQASIRRLPALIGRATAAAASVAGPASAAPMTEAPRAGATVVTAVAPPTVASPVNPPLPSDAAPHAGARPVIRATAPERYRVQFTMGPDTHDKLRRVQDLLRREIPDGDPAAIFDRALTLLLAEVERRKVGAMTQATRSKATRAIRPGTDPRSARTASRYIPNAVKRVVWRRDGGRCAFVSPDGRRCAERAFLEIHHIRPYAHDGPATVENLSLRCRLHNQYEAELAFAPSQPFARPRTNPARRNERLAETSAPRPTHASDQGARKVRCEALGNVATARTST